jgi:hypothetical protein
MRSVFYRIRGLVLGPAQGSRAQVPDLLAPASEPVLVRDWSVLAQELVPELDWSVPVPGLALEPEPDSVFDQCPS